MQKEFQAKTGYEGFGVEEVGELVPIGEEEGIEGVCGFCGELRAEQIACDGSGGRNGPIIFSEFRKGIEECGIFEKVQVLFAFAIDPFGLDEWGSHSGKGGRFYNEGEEADIRCEDFEDFLST